MVVNLVRILFKNSSSCRTRLDWTDVAASQLNTSNYERFCYHFPRAAVGRERFCKLETQTKPGPISTDTLHKQREVCGLQLAHHLEQVEAQVVHSAAILVLNDLAGYTSKDVEESLDTETGDEATC